MLVNNGGQFLPKNTNFAKGVALMLILLHHLFYSGHYVFDLANFQLWATLSVLAKICVAMFVILSGVGLARSWAAKKNSLAVFYRRHISKIYMTYWLIWLLFVPAGAVFFDRSMADIYGTGAYLKPLAVNILGFQLFSGVNLAWWFVGLIVILYLLFPLLFWAVKRWNMAFVVFTFGFYFVPQFGYYLQFWVFPFVLGIWTAQNNILEFLKNHNFLEKGWTFIWGIVVLSAARLYLVSGHHAGMDTFVDALLAFAVIAAGYVYCKEDFVFYAFVTLVGVNSFNIFLFHGFLYEHYFSDFTYFLKYPPLVFVQFLLVCLGISLAIEKLKGFFKRGINLGWRKFNVKEAV